MWVTLGCTHVCEVGSCTVSDSDAPSRVGIRMLYQVITRKSRARTVNSVGFTNNLETFTILKKHSIQFMNVSNNTLWLKSS